MARTYPKVRVQLVFGVNYDCDCECWPVGGEGIAASKLQQPICSIDYDDMNTRE